MKHKFILPQVTIDITKINIQCQNCDNIIDVGEVLYFGEQHEKDNLIREFHDASKSGIAEIICTKCCDPIYFKILTAYTIEVM